MLVRSKWLMAVALLLVGINAFAQTTGSIQGQVMDQQGQALPGVTVKLTGDPIQGAERIAATDARGDFKYNALPVGRYSLSASLQGYIPRRPRTSE